MAKQACPTIWTVGYEGSAQHDVLELLAGAGVTRLVDVRIRAQSRKAGFSKTSLGAGLATIGIAYEHLRDLGTPIDIRAEFRAGNTEEGRAQYRAYLTGDPAAQLAFDALRDRLDHDRVAILCFEHDHRVCHREVIVEELVGRHSVSVVHLGAPVARTSM